MLINTEREKEIKLGTSYPFEPLQTGFCLLSSYQSVALALNVGDEIQIEMNLTATMNAIMNNYNAIATTNSWQILTNGYYNETINITC